LESNVDFDEIVYQPYVLHKVRQGMQDVEAGRGISGDELAREISAWQTNLPNGDLEGRYPNALPDHAVMPPCPCR
jgi:hypothetical protein